MPTRMHLRLGKLRTVLHWTRNTQVKSEFEHDVQRPHIVCGNCILYADVMLVENAYGMRLPDTIC